MSNSHFILINSNEPLSVRKAFMGIAQQEPLDGFDIAIFTPNGTVGIERKRVPGDLLSSVDDGRLARELIALKSNCDYPILLLERRFHWSQDDKLMSGNKETRWTRQGVRNLLRSVRYIHGVDVEYSSSLADTLALVQEIAVYFGQREHLSLQTRPRLVSAWPIATYEERYLFWLQGLPGISISRAKAIIRVFPTPISLLGASLKAIRQADGIGPKLAQDIMDFLHCKGQWGNGQKEEDTQKLVNLMYGEY